MSNIDEVLKRINTSTVKLRQKEANSFAGKFGMYKDSTVKFWSQVWAGSKWIYTWTLKPVVKFLSKPASWVARKYMDIWFWWVYDVNQYDVKKFVAWKAGVMLIATALVFWQGLHFGWDASMYALTAEKHVSYLNNSQEVTESSNIHAVRGCDEKPGCSNLEAIYYRADPDLFNQFWSVINHGTLFFPDFVAAAVPPTTHKCTVYTYGFRWKWLVRWDVYPEILHVYGCEPVKE